MIRTCPLVLASASLLLAAGCCFDLSGFVEEAEALRARELAEDDGRRAQVRARVVSLESPPGGPTEVEVELVNESDRLAQSVAIAVRGFTAEGDLAAIVPEAPAGEVPASGRTTRRVRIEARHRIASHPVDRAEVELYVASFSTLGAAPGPPPSGPPVDHSGR